MHDLHMHASHLILADDAEEIRLHLNSSETYPCLGGIYRMNCTSSQSFNVCGLSHPNWEKDGQRYPVNSSCTESIGPNIEQLTVHIPNDADDSNYSCGYKRGGCQSNSFPVKPLRKLDHTFRHTHAAIHSQSIAEAHLHTCVHIIYDIVLLPFRPTTSPCDTK